VLNEAAKLLGISLRETEDELTRDMLASTAVVIAAVNGFNNDTPTELTAADLQDVYSKMIGNDAKTLISMVEAQNKFGKLCAEVKSWVIDLEALRGDKAQAQAA